MSGRAIALGLALVAVAAMPAVAGASTISGKVAGAKLPKGNKGFSSVRAVRAKDLVILDVAKVRSARYKLKVPAGTYWLLGSTTPFRGKAGVDPGGAKVTVRKGKKKTVRVSLRKRTHKVPRLPTLPSGAHAAFVTSKHPAVWVQHFSTPDDLRQLRRGLANMLIDDLLAPLQRACSGRIVEREKFDWLITEQLLSQSRHGNPSTRLPTDKMIAHNREVSGSLTVSGPTSTLTVVVKNVVTGTTRSVTRSAPNDRFFELETAVIQETVRLICGDKPPAAYSGQATHSLSGSDGGSSQTLSWSGNVRLKYTGDLLPATGGDPPGEYASYAAESGSFHVILDGTEGSCTYHGEANVTIVPDPGHHSRVQQGVDEPTYSLGANFPADVPPLRYAITGPTECHGGTTGFFPLAGRAYLQTITSQRSSSSMLVGTSIWAAGPVAMRWGWSLAPQAY
jgi:hypothetical protein